MNEKRSILETEGALFTLDAIQDIMRNLSLLKPDEIDLGPRAFYFLADSIDSQRKEISRALGLLEFDESNFRNIEAA